MGLTLLVVLSALGGAAPAAADTFVVDTGGDGNLATCGPAANDCTLRGAVNAANATPAPDTIMLPALRIAVTSPLPPISAPLTIKGAGARSSIIDGTGKIGIVIASGFGSDTTLQNLEITGARRRAGNSDAAVEGVGAMRRVAIIDNRSIGLLADNTSVADSLIARNTGEGVGGVEAMGSASISNSTIANNTGVLSGVPPLAGPLVWSGGVINAAGLLEIDHSTIANNKVVAGAALLTGTNLGTVAVLNPATVVRSSVIGGSLTPNCGGPNNSNGHNIDADGSCHFTSAGDHSSIDPLLAPLANNGGPTDTIALLPGSPAIDAGDDCPAADQRGQPRTQGATCDAGAFESAFTSPASTPTATEPAPTQTSPTATPTATTTPTPPATTVAAQNPARARDTTPPSLTVGGIPKTLSRTALRAGVRIRVRANEPIAAELELLVAPRRVRTAWVQPLARATLPLATVARSRTVKLKPQRPLAGTRRTKAQLRVVAFDAAGNRSAKTIRLTIR